MSDYSNLIKDQSSFGNDEEIQGTSYTSSFVNGLKGYIQLSGSEEEEQSSGQKESIIRKASSCCSLQPSYFKFGIFLTLGLTSLGLSMMFLPIIWLAPQKFVTLFSFGCFFTIFSFMFFYGPKEFFGIIFSQERQAYTLVFSVLTFVGIYYSFNPTLYLISLLCSVIQLIITTVFVFSFIPGGKSGISFIFSMITAPFRKLFSK